MDRRVFYLFVLLAAFVIGGARRMQAQIAENVDVNIPFQFHVGGKQLPAGNYVIRSVSPTDGTAMEIQRADGRVVALFLAERSDMSSATGSDGLIFDQVGNNYFLSQIVDADRGTDTEVFNSDDREKPDAADRPAGYRHIFGFLRAF